MLNQGVATGIAVFTTRLFFRLTLLAIIITGVFFTVKSKRELAEIRRQHQELREKVGLLTNTSDTTDKQIYVVRAELPDELLSDGMEEIISWRFRLSLPIDYDACFASSIGRIKSNSPGVSGSSNTMYSFPCTEREERTLLVSFIKDAGSWKVSVTEDTGSWSCSIPPEFPIQDLENATVEMAADYAVSRAYNSGDAVCLLRIHDGSMANVEKPDKDENLHNGFVVYMFNKEQESEFVDWTMGKSKSMKSEKQ